MVGKRFLLFVKSLGHKPMVVLTCLWFMELLLFHIPTINISFQLYVKCVFSLILEMRASVKYCSFYKRCFDL